MGKGTGTLRNSKKGGQSKEYKKQLSAINKDRKAFINSSAGKLFAKVVNDSENMDIAYTKARSIQGVSANDAERFSKAFGIKANPSNSAIVEVSQREAFDAFYKAVKVK